MRENIEWLIEQYTDKIEELESEAKSQGFGLTYLNGQLATYSKVVGDLQSILDESEDDI